MPKILLRNLENHLLIAILFCSSFSPYRDCRVVRDPQTMKSKGYGFVSFVKKTVSTKYIRSLFVTCIYFGSVLFFASIIVLVSCWFSVAVFPFSNSINCCSWFFPSLVLMFFLWNSTVLFLTEVLIFHNFHWQKERNVLPYRAILFGRILVLCNSSTTNYAYINDGFFGRV